MFYLTLPLFVYLDILHTQSQSAPQFAEINLSTVMSLITLIILMTTFVVRSREKRRRDIEEERSMKDRLCAAEANIKEIREIDIKEMKDTMIRGNDELKGMIHEANNRIVNLTDHIIKLTKK
jgi:guanylate kinase